MTTSGTTTFTQTRDQIINRALRQVGAIASGETPGAQLVSDAADALNALVKEWNALGIHLWTESEGSLFLQANQVSYSLGTNSTDHATQTYNAGTLSANAANAAGTISVTSISGMSSGDNIGVVLDDGTLFWTTINGAPAGHTVTLTAALTDSSTSGNNVYNYTTNLLRPLRIPAGRRYNISSAIETPLIRMSRLDYRDLPNKTNPGIPTQFFYDPQLSAGVFYVWPAPIDVTNLVKFTWYRTIQDFNAQGDTPDFPQEWINALTWNLAVQIAPEYDCPVARFGILKVQAKESFETVQGWDREPESVFFGVSMDPMSR